MNWSELGVERLEPLGPAGKDTKKKKKKPAVF